MLQNERLSSRLSLYLLIIFPVGKFSLISLLERQKIKVSYGTKKYRSTMRENLTIVCLSGRFKRDISILSKLFSHSIKDIQDRKQTTQNFSNNISGDHLREQFNIPCFLLLNIFAYPYLSIYFLLFIGIYEFIRGSFSNTIIQQKYNLLSVANYPMNSPT